MTASLTLALWQSAGTAGDVAANLAEIARAAAQARAAGADLLIFPECFLTGYFCDDPAARVAQIPPDIHARLGQIAAENALCIVLGTMERFDAALRNAAWVIDPQQGFIGAYAKRMLYGDWEKTHFQRGTGPFAFAYRGWNLSLLICFDVEFPGLARAAAQGGCDALIVPTALMAPYANVPAHLVCTRALENQIYVAYANRIGNDGPIRYLGQSVIAGPDGSALARAGDGAQMLTCTITRAALDQTRADFSYLDEESASGIH